MSICDNLNKIKQLLPKNVTLVAVSKTHPVELIMEAYNAGQRVFGENKVQEMLSKYEVMPKDIEWHLIGHLQTNKVKYAVPFVKLIHSVDSLKLLKVIDREAAAVNRVVDCLFQVHVAREETKFGFLEQELIDLLQLGEFNKLQNVRMTGIMGMASLTEDMNQVRAEFKSLNVLFNKVKSSYYSNCDWFNTLSMGMSHDFNIAVEEGSSMVRVGSSIFGQRNYPNKL